MLILCLYFLLMIVYRIKINFKKMIQCGRVKFLSIDNQLIQLNNLIYNFFNVKLNISIWIVQIWTICISRQYKSGLYESGQYFGTRLLGAIALLRPHDNILAIKYRMLYHFILGVYCPNL